MESLTINENYAQQYEKRKRAEELSRLQEKYGELPSEEYSSSSEEEDEEGEEDTEEKSRNFLRTLSLLKKKDPRIYNKEAEFYREKNTQSRRTKENDKPMYLKDYERSRLLERGIMAELSDSEEEQGERGNVTVERMTYNQEQKDIRKSFKRAAADLAQEEDDGVLTIRHKTKEEKQQEEAEYIKWLKGHQAELQNDEKQDMDALQRYWTDPNLDPDEVFLRDYILNKGWIDDESKRIPSYNEIISDYPDPSDDEDEIEKQDDFEHKFNFRFEEPGGTEIVSYPRKVGGSVRRTDEKRKEKRKEREERKAKEKEQKKEEIRRLKNLKKQEIIAKLERLKRITGNPVVGFKEEDFEGDFDASNHDNMMREIFDSEYYEEGGVGEEEKPEFSDSEEEEDWDNWAPPLSDERDQDEPHCEDPDFNMDADYDPEGEEEMVSKRKRRRQNLFSKTMKKKKPMFDPENQAFEEYFDEYYKLDYEDIIAGDLPCRFHYRETVPNNFGLSTEEILVSEDKELNKWVSLKKAVQYRAEDEEKADVKRYSRKAKDLNKKQRVLVTMTTREKEQNEQERKKGNLKEKLKMKRNKKRGGASTVGSGGVSEARLSSYGIAKRMKSKRRKKGKSKK